ncbi:MAG TPA: CRISPR-associated endonuclease Cas2 [Accumulibacter sp.]|nr:CRISPR-associated endonuclease Cas2 [Accumulibacter sp.]HNC18211.1 CRISPR-associated endonuclease Cas2 [Accumulibacter sp.]HND79871.1 CRISPR-associated endonuclease Cas2 [Accumulibacter sp.]HNE12266.1 CRISPR-associated endonuclease Cas2 [Accumulibacter sp.]HNJ99820.1 CRISPR-associated endonuclease Cas2 [Accumulibacter sp.]
MLTTVVYLVAYDIADPKRLRRIERTIAAVGERLHNSLFVCELTEIERERLQRRVARLIDAAVDSVQYVPWCERDQRMTRHLGTSQESLSANTWIV